MAEFKQNYFQRRTKPKGPKANHRINSSEVQVIASTGENLGIMNTSKAITIAKEEGLLIGISAGALVATALEIAREEAKAGRAATIVAVCCDGGSRYLSDHFWEEGS